MSRRKSREQAFALLFEKSFNDLPVMDLAEGAQDAREFIIEPFALELAQGAEEKLAELDALIEANSHKWSHNRISRVALAVLRLAIYEMRFNDEKTPDSIAINEAVELAKRYGGEEDSSFVNGILGSISRAEV
ncbi:MAG: transcription antitermination factor NusB [Clostridia bacterium]|nr:transcription antitermination factor NusB [Clostridia bacterium]